MKVEILKDANEFNTAFKKGDTPLVSVGVFKVLKDKDIAVEYFKKSKRQED